MVEISMNSKIRQNYNDNINVFMFLCIVAAIAGKLIETLFLPEKYFFDSNRIVEMVNETVPKSNWYKGSYKVAADFFKRINIFHFNSRT